MRSKRLRVPRRLVKRTYRRSSRLLELERVEDRLLLATITVNSAVDSNNPADPTLSLREAIELSNGTLAVSSLSSQAQLQVSGTPHGTGADTVNFNITPAGLNTITINGSLGALPTIAHPTMINGTTQPGFTTTPVIVLDGTSAGTGANGLTIAQGGDGSTIEGFAINQFNGDGISIVGANNDLIEGTFLGTDATGTAVLRNHGDGIGISGANNTTVGGTTSQARNIISGNVGNGVNVSGGSTGTLIEGNYIGLDTSGKMAADANLTSFGNHGDGVLVNGATGTTIGGTATGTGNVLSNNGGFGIELPGNGGAGNTLVQGNFIGTDVSGTKALGNVTAGIAIESSLANTIGGTSAAARNIISGNQREGIFLASAGNTVTPANDVIEGNYIGTDSGGTKNLGNGLSGITLLNSAGNTIGGTASSAGNLISGNGTGTAPGISLTGSGTQNNIVEGDLIGPDFTGSHPLAGGVAASNSIGIAINAGPSINTIGAIGAGNTIAFNNGQGIAYFNGTGFSTAGNTIRGNTITANGGDGVAVVSTNTQNLGVTIDSNTVTLNNGNGIVLVRVDGTQVTSNTISRNATDGVQVDTGTGNTIRGNTIFSDASTIEIDLVNGGNDNQAAPVLFTATSAGGSTTITGTLQSTPITQFLLDFFSSPASNGPGFGEGQTFLGSPATVVATDSTGKASFSLTVPVAVAADQFLTATARNVATGDTSAFSKTPPDVAVTLSAAPEPVNQTTNLTYSLTLANHGPSPAVGAVLTDTLPTGVTFVSATGGGTLSSGVVTFPAVTLNRGASQTYMIVVTVNTGTGPLTDTASATTANAAALPDLTPTDNSSMVNSTVNPVADLMVTGTAAPEPVDQGTNLVYTLTATNNGPSPAVATTVTTPIPAGATLISATGGITPSGGKLTFNLGTLAALASQMVSFTIQPSVVGPLAETVTIASTTTDLVPANNTTTINSTVAPVADLMLTGKAAPEPVDQGTNLVYTLTATNNGPSPAPTATITAPIPAGATFASASGGITPVGGNLTFNLSNLAVGAANAQMVTFTIQPSIVGPLAETVTIASATADLNLANNTTTIHSTVAPVADLMVTGTGAPEPVDQGTNLVYTLTATNNGPSPAPTATITAPIPAGATFVSASGGITSVGGNLTFNLSNLAVGAANAQTVTFTIQPSIVGPLAETVAIASTTHDLNLVNNTTTIHSTVAPVADLMVTGTAAPEPVDQGTNLVYTLTATNNGPSAAPAATITAPIPAGATFVSASGGITPVGGNLTFNLSNLAVGAASAQVVTFTIQPSIVGPLAETVMIASTTADLNLANNTATIHSTVAPVADLAVTDTASPEPVNQTQSLTYTLKVTNNGPSPATAVTLVDTLDPGVSYTSDNGGGVVAGNMVTFNLGTLNAGASKTVMVVATVNARHSVSNSATASTPTADLNLQNNTAMAVSTVNPIADIALTGVSSPEPVDVGSNLTYTLTLTNNGPSSSSGILVTDTLPAGITFVSASSGGVLVGSNVQFALANPLASGASTTLTIVVTPGAAGPIVDTASVASETTDLVAGNNETTINSTVNPVADLAMTNSTDVSTVVQFNNVTFHVKVTNNGPSPATNVTLTDTMPTNAAFVWATGGVTPSGSTLTFNVGSLAAGASATYDIVLQAFLVGTNTDTVTASSTTTDRNSANNTATASVNVTPSFVVTNANGSGPGSLRFVIQNIDDLPASAPPVNVQFNIPGTGPLVIRPTTLLPAITHPATFDAVASTAKLAAALEIDGSQIATGPAPQNIANTPGLLDMDAPNVVVRGFTLRGFSGFGIVLDTHSGSDTIAGDYIGTNPAGTAVTQANMAGGILVLSAKSTIGGTTAADQNVISGNAFGVYLLGSGASGNAVIGNKIGTDKTGTTILGSNADKVDGIEIDGASGNTIGGPTGTPGQAPGNLIEGYQAGIYLFDGASNNVIQGNAIRSNGISTSSNAGQELGGILLTNASNNMVGGTAAGAGNDLSNNHGSGVVIFNSRSGNTLAANHINNNSSTGVYILNAAGNHVGINGAGNMITGNAASGVDLEGSSASQNTVVANTIQGSGQDGVYLFNAPSNAIGGTNSGDGNTIQNNGFNGVHLEGSGATGNTVQGNTIANQSAGYGVLLENGATGNTIGGAGSAANTFSNNALGNVQVLVNGSPPSSDPTGGNTIGPNTTAAGLALAAFKLKKYLKQVHHKTHVHHRQKHHAHPQGPGPRFTRN
jgi:uncharacterized repeat protein (TIGR01451 family)